MSKITQIISTQRFESIRDRILEILVDEMDHQYYLTSDEDLNVSVFIERNNPIDKTELSAIVVSLAKGAYSNKNQGSVDGDYIYNVDVYTNSKTTENGAGDTLAAIKMQKLMGVCRSILEDPIYKTLGFAPPFLMKTNVSEFNIAAGNKEDALNTGMGRLTFNVTTNETNKLIVPNLIEGYETTVKIDNSGKGYFYQGENY